MAPKKKRQRQRHSDLLVDEFDESEALALVLGIVHGHDQAFDVHFSKLSSNTF
jgi:hypothetical protein